MRNSVAALGIAALGGIGGATSAAAAADTPPPGAMICHLTEAGTYEPFFVSVHGLIHDLNGHAAHTGDIIPFPGFGGDPAGQNMTPENVSILNNGCVGDVAATSGPVQPVAPAAPAQAPPNTARNLGYNVDGAVQSHAAPAVSGNASNLWAHGGWAVITGALAGWARIAWVRSRKVAR